MDTRKLHTGEFQSTIRKPSHYRFYDRVAYKMRSAADRRNADQSTSSAYGILMKIGLCAAACALVVLVNGAGGQSPVAEQEIPGRLKFVELPSIIEVFAPGDGKLAFPVREGHAEMISDDTVLCITVGSEQVIAAGVECTVRAIGRDEGYGDYVRLSAASDVEYMYYGFTSVNVEEGQRLKRVDSLGLVAANSRLYVCVNVSGRPAQVQEYFSVESGV